MLTGRGLGLVGGALALWLGSRLMGSGDVHMLAAGLVVVAPLAAAYVRWSRQRFAATRRLSARRAFQGTRVRVDLELRNTGAAGASTLLLEDRLPPSLGRAARAVLTGVPPHGRRSITYTLVCRNRGRYRVGPLSVIVSDPFDLARRRIEVPGHQELIVYPEVEDLQAPRRTSSGLGSGESAARQLFRSGEEFYTMRPYETGDDLRRIHWPSTARTGELMIRQDEAARRSLATLFLDTRVASVGGRPEVFEKAVSAAASIGAHHLRHGFTLRLATPDLRPRPASREEFLELLAIVEPSRERSVTPALLRLRGQSATGATFVCVTHLPSLEESAALSRAASGFGARIAVLLYPQDPERLPQRAHAELAVRAEAARAALLRAGWDVLLLSPTGRLRDLWQLRTRTRAAAGS